VKQVADPVASALEIGCGRTQAHLSASVRATSTATAYAKRELSPEYIQSCARMHARTLSLVTLHWMARNERGHCMRSGVQPTWPSVRACAREISHRATNTTRPPIAKRYGSLHGCACMACSCTAQTQERQKKVLAWRQLPHRGGGAVVWAQVMQSGRSAH
jgi:hypothetical protein